MSSCPLHQAKDHRPSGILGEVWWGALSKEGRKLDRCSKVIIGFPVSIPGALIKRRGPDPPLSPCRINTKSKHHHKGESGFGKASDRVKAEDHRPSGILGEVRWGALSREGRTLDRCSKVILEKARPLFEGHYRVPSLYPRRSNQALRPGPPPKPLSN